MGYICMRGSKVDVGVVRISYTAAFAIRIVGNRQFTEVTTRTGPCEDGHCEQDDSQSNEDNQANDIGAFPPFV